jgi:hypothetical protein
MAAPFQYFNSFTEALAEKVHNLGADTLKVMLTNTEPDAADAVKTDITEISAGFGYTAGGTATTISSSAQSGGTYKLVITDVTFTAASGEIGPFQWAILYNDTATNDELIGFYDYEAPVTILDTENFVVDFDPTTGVLQLATGGG